MAEIRIPAAIQESITTAVALVDNDDAKLIASLVDPSKFEEPLFDPPLDDIIERSIEYRKKFKRPPGKEHIDDVFGFVLENPKNRQYASYKRNIEGMLRQADTLNTRFILENTNHFVRLELLRLTMQRGIAHYQRNTLSSPDDIENEFREALREKTIINRDYGFTLADERALNFLDRNEHDFCRIGIKQLDEIGVVPTRKELFAFLSAPNKGKSWFLTHCGRLAIMQGWRVAHYTLENSDDMTAQRYFQTLFSGVKWDGDYHYSKFSTNDNDDELRIHQEVLKPAFVIEDLIGTERFLGEKRKEYQHRLENLRIRRFPSGRLSLEMLERDLDELQVAYDFEPDMVLLDMPQLMRMPRHGNGTQAFESLNELVTGLRGIAVDRNQAWVVPQQGNRASGSAKNVQAIHGSQSYGVVGIADNMLTYSQTTSEEERGLARLYLQKVRNDKARITLLIAQHYASGQFCLGSWPLTKQARAEEHSYLGTNDDLEDSDFDEPEAEDETPKKVRHTR